MASKMLLVDGNSLMHRAFHALPVMTSDSGEYTNALHGFMMMLLRVIADEKPDLCAVAFDRHAPTFRHLKYEAYKAGRTPTPDELRPQFASVRDVLSEMHIRIIEMDGYEADDILGTLSLMCEEKGIDNLIITGDRDAFQLAGPHTTVLYTRQGIKDTERVTPEFIREKWNLSPVQLIDMKGLMGDTSDNYPGVPGVGEKTAQKLIERYGSVESVLDHADADQKGKLRERLLEGRASALESKWLATIERHAPLGIAPEDCPLHNLKDGAGILARLQLRQVSARLETLSEAEDILVSIHVPEAGECELLTLPDFSARLDALSADIIAVSLGTHLCVASNDGTNIALRLGGDLIDPGVSDEEAASLLQPLLNRAKLIVLHDLKRLLGQGFAFPGAVFDVMLAGYLLNPQRRSFSLTSLCAEAQLPLNEDQPAGTMLRLYAVQHNQLRKDGMEKLYHDIELPLARVLHDMERAGILTDEEALRALSERFNAHIESLMAGIRELAGEELNVNSPKQLGTFLFETLGLPGGKKTKTGWSTSADALEAIQDEHPLVRQVLEYRKYAKLKSTYVDALLRLRDREGRIHTSFDQTATVTGRISSLEPNLQNIPVRTTLGREIRRAFIARPGWQLVDADYSQIELRVLAHMSGDHVMIDAFRRGQDIHARTAAEVYGVPLEEVTPEMRSSSKAVNFGIVYGISDFGLARGIGVSRAEASEFIRRYFARYPDVKRYLDSCVALGSTQGYVTTYFNRRRYLPELSDRSYSIRQFGERAAMNSPIQGTAADIIKLAMIRVHEALGEQSFSARLILQVHDELIVEAPDDEAQAAASLLKACMETIVSLDVPLVAEVNIGHSWYDCK
ncbi:MAG: DNA polymerase I [Clostridia bacterium]|nr:DNA polymerase I [Clostridia bacterium]